MVSGTLELLSMEKNTIMVAELVTICLHAPHLVSKLKILTKFWWLGQPTKVMELGITEVPEEMFMEML